MQKPIPEAIAEVSDWDQPGSCEIIGQHQWYKRVSVSADEVGWLVEHTRIYDFNRHNPAIEAAFNEGLRLTHQVREYVGRHMCLDKGPIRNLISKLAGDVCCLRKLTTPCPMLVVAHAHGAHEHLRVMPDKFHPFPGAACRI